MMKFYFLTLNFCSQKYTDDLHHVHRVQFHLRWVGVMHIHASGNPHIMMASVHSVLSIWHPEHLFLEEWVSSDDGVSCLMCLRHFSTIAVAHTVCCLFLEIRSKFSVLLWASCHLLLLTGSLPTFSLLGNQNPSFPMPFCLGLRYTHSLFKRLF